MIKKIENKPQGPVEIDLTGPDGNVYSLIKQARKFANDIGLDADQIQEDMISGSYEHAVNVFEKHFGKYVILWR